MHQVYAADSIDVTTKWSGPVNGSIVTRETTRRDTRFSTRESYPEKRCLSTFRTAEHSSTTRPPVRQAINPTFSEPRPERASRTVRDVPTGRSGRAWPVVPGDPSVDWEVSTASNVRESDVTALAWQ